MEGKKTHGINIKSLLHFRHRLCSLSFNKTSPGLSTASPPKFHTQCADVTVLHPNPNFIRLSPKMLVITTKPIGLQQRSCCNRPVLHSENTIQKLYILVGLLAPAITSLPPDKPVISHCCYYRMWEIIRGKVVCKRITPVENFVKIGRMFQMGVTRTIISYATSFP
jgi:hypothetical protein